MEMNLLPEKLEKNKANILPNYELTIKQEYWFVFKTIFLSDIWLISLSVSTRHNV